MESNGCVGRDARPQVEGLIGWKRVAAEIFLHDQSGVRLLFGSLKSDTADSFQFCIATKYFSYHPIVLIVTKKYTVY